MKTEGNLTGCEEFGVSTPSGGQSCLSPPSLTNSFSLSFQEALFYYVPVTNNFTMENPYFPFLPNNKTSIIITFLMKTLISKIFHMSSCICSQSNLYRSLILPPFVCNPCNSKPELFQGSIHLQLGLSFNHSHKSYIVT